MVDSLRNTREVWTQIRTEEEPLDVVPVRTAHARAHTHTHTHTPSLTFLRKGRPRRRKPGTCWQGPPGGGFLVLTPALLAWP